MGHDVETRKPLDSKATGGGSLRGLLAAFGLLVLLGLVLKILTGTGH